LFSREKRQKNVSTDGGESDRLSRGRDVEKKEKKPPDEKKKKEISDPHLKENIRA